METTKRILIIGGGYGGVWAGKILEKQFRKREDIEITLVDKRPFHTLMTELHEVAGWRAEPTSVQVSFRKIFGAKRINCVVDTITKVDFGSKVAHSTTKDYPFDYVIVGAGAQPEFFGTPGIKENSFTLWSFEDAMRIRQHLETVFDRAVQETDPAERRKLLTFVVAGAGFTGIEMAGELLEYRDQMCRSHYIDKSETRVVVIEALPNILPMLEEGLRSKAEKRLHTMGCELMVNTPIVGAEPGKVLLKQGEPVETATFIWTCGVTACDFGASLGLTVGKRNRLEVDQGLRSPSQGCAYIVGDGAGLMLNGKPMAQIVESAHFSAEAAAKNIIADIDGGERHEFKPNYHGFMVCVGSHWGVSNAGGIRLSGWLALVMKHIVNMWYLLNIAGLNQVWEYAKDEVLDMKSGRSLFGGFFAHKERSYWILLLRMWLGLSWLFEGINKIGEGWFAFSSGSKSGWMFSSGVVQAGVKVSDATSAATAAAGTAAAATTAATSAATAAASTASTAATAAQGAANAVSAATAAGAATAASAADATSAATQAAGAATTQAKDAFHAVWDLTQPILDPNAGIVKWFKHVFMDGLFSHLSYQFFQVMIVSTEMAIGLILLGGFFTWFGAVGSMALCLVFTLSGMFRWDQLWFFFAAIVMMGGAGRSIGLDYWSVPFFKRWWNGTKFARRWHFYADNPTK